MINNNLRAIRKKRGIPSAIEFAKMLGRPVSTVTSHENGSRSISIKDLEIYSKFLETSKESILNTDIKIENSLSVGDISIIVAAFCSVQKRAKTTITKKEIKKIIENISNLDFQNQENIELLIELSLVNVNSTGMNP